MTTYLNLPVIYKIQNNITGDIYIGSAQNFRRRKNDHLHRLRNNKHYSKYLQRSWNKYGENSFSIIPIIYCDEVNLILYEQTFIDNLKPIYNSKPIANSMLGFKHPSKSKLSMSKSKMGKKRLWKVDCTNSRLASIGNEFSAKNYEGFISPNGVKIGIIFNLNKFCRENNLDSAHLLDVYKGKRKSHKGWTNCRIKQRNIPNSYR